MKVFVYPGQNLIDVAIQYYGCYEGVFQLMKDNDLALDDFIITGQELTVLDQVPELVPGNLQMVLYLKNKGLIVSSGTYRLSMSEDIGDFTEEFTNEFY